jgi:hypothetical protein
LYKNLPLPEVIQRLEDKYGAKKKIIEGAGTWI